MIKDNMYIGSNFDKFLNENELLDEVTAIAMKRVFIHKHKISKIEMKSNMNTSCILLNGVYLHDFNKNQ